MSGLHFSKVRLLTDLLLGGCMFLMVVPLSFLARAQELEYVQHHFPAFYAWFVRTETIIILEFVGLGFLCLALVELWMQRREKPAKAPEVPEKPSSPQSHIAPIFQTTFAPVFENKPSNLADARAISVATAPVQVARKPEPEPHLIKLPPRTAWVQVEESCYRERESTYTKAVLAVYENETQDKETGDLKYAVAKITYSDERGQEFTELRVNEGCWINAGNEVHFPANTRHQLIIAIKNSSHYQIVREISKYPSVHNALFEQEQLFVKVQLIAKNRTWRTDRYLLTATEKEFSLTPID